MNHESRWELAFVDEHKTKPMNAFPCIITHNRDFSIPKYFGLAFHLCSVSAQTSDASTEIPHFCEPFLSKRILQIALWVLWFSCLVVTHGLEKETNEIRVCCSSLSCGYSFVKRNELPFANFKFPLSLHLATCHSFLSTSKPTNSVRRASKTLSADKKGLGTFRFAIADLVYVWLTWFSFCFQDSVVASSAMTKTLSTILFAIRHSQDLIFTRFYELFVYWSKWTMNISQGNVVTRLNWFWRSSTWPSKRKKFYGFVLFHASSTPSTTVQRNFSVCSEAKHFSPCVTKFNPQANRKFDLYLSFNTSNKLPFTFHSI